LKIVVKYFSACREAAGNAHEVVTVRDDSSVGSLMEALLSRHPDLEPLREEMMYAVNKEYASAERRLADGDEVALLPPVSGG
jgi:molybdopterin converting factor subunit 1